MASFTERTERTEPTERIEPTEPTERIEPTEPTERIEPTERTQRREIDVTDQPASTRTSMPAPRATVGNGAAIAALVTGLLSATFAFLIAPALAAVIFGAVAIGLGVKGVGIANSLGGMHKGLAVTGIVSGVLGLLLGVAVIVGGITLWNELEQTDIPNQIQQLID